MANSGSNRTVTDLVPYLYKNGFQIPALLKEDGDPATLYILIQSLTEEELDKMKDWFSEPIRSHVLIVIGMTPELREVIEPITINKRTTVEIKAFFDRTLELCPDGARPVALVTPEFLRTLIQNYDSQFFVMELTPAKDPFGPIPHSLPSVKVNGVSCSITQRDTEFAAMAISALGTVVTTKQYVTLIKADLREMKKRRDEKEKLGRKNST